MLMPFPLLVSKTIFNMVPLTRGSPSLKGCLMIGVQWPCEGKEFWAFLPWYKVEILTGDMQGAPEEFLYAPCLLHTKQHPSPWRMFLFSVVLPHPKKTSSQAQYT
jgi:hypothetical protein